MILIEESIRFRAINPIRKLFKFVLLIGTISILVVSMIQLNKSKQEMESLLIYFIDQVSKTADVESNLIILQREVDYISLALEFSSKTSNHVQLLLNNRLVASSGSLKPKNQFSLNAERNINLASSGNLKIIISTDIFALFWRTLLLEAMLLLFFLVAIQILKIRVEKSLEDVTEPIERLVESLNHESSINEKNIKIEDNNKRAFSEILLLRKSIQSFLRRIQEHQDEIITLKQNETYGQIAQQVAHDIRSPLAALNMVATSLSELPETKRLLLRNATQRINDIANDLLLKSKRTFTEPSQTSLQSHKLSEAVLLMPLIDSVLSEKRVLQGDSSRIKIEFEFKDTYDAFAECNSVELARIISNLINNSIEAFSNKEGIIQLKMQTTDQHVLLDVVDNGSGIPEEILRKLGSIQISYGKQSLSNGSGSGLGVYHAKRSLEEWGGDLQIQSILGHGTVFKMKIKKSPHPSWFAKSIHLPDHGNIYIIDDDQSIHDLWTERFTSIGWDQKRMIHFKSPVDFKKSSVSEADLCLIDYEYLGYTENGLDIIEEKKIINNSILVTSRFNTKNILDRALDVGVKILPKILITYTPIVQSNLTHLLDAILIDDDPLIGSLWEMDAKEKNKNFLWFSNPKDFLQSAETFSKATPIFIDISLSDGMRGELVAQKIINLGFKKIYFATGYQMSSIEIPNGVTGVVGKEPIWG